MTRRKNDQNNWYLRLKDLKPTDSGKYTCIVSNPYGSINHTYTLQVIGEYYSNLIFFLLNAGSPRWCGKY